MLKLLWMPLGEGCGIFWSVCVPLCTSNFGIILVVVLVIGIDLCGYGIGGWGMIEGFFIGVELGKKLKLGIMSLLV